MEYQGSGGNIVVLIVEDEPLLLMAAEEFVVNAGFTAIVANGADEAIRILESRDDIRIVFTDVDMPGSMDGLKLAAAIRNRWPPIDLIITSGHRSVTLAELPERGVYFPKPYVESEVISVMNRMLA